MSDNSEINSSTETQRTDPSSKSEERPQILSRNQNRRNNERNNERNTDKMERSERGPPSAPLYSDGGESSSDRRGVLKNINFNPRERGDRPERGERRERSRNYQNKNNENRRRNERNPNPEQFNPSQNNNNNRSNSYSYEPRVPVVPLSSNAASPSGPLVIGFIGRDPTKTSPFANLLLSRNAFKGESFLDENQCIIQHFHDTEENVLYLTLSSGLDVLHSNAPYHVKEELNEWLQKQGRSFIRSFYYMSYVCHHLMVVDSGSRVDSVMMSLISQSKGSFQILNKILQSQLSQSVFESVHSGCKLNFVVQSPLTDQTPEHQKTGKRTRENLEKCLEVEMKTLLSKTKWVNTFNEPQEELYILSTDSNKLVHVVSCPQPISEPNPMMELFIASLSSNPLEEINAKYQENHTKHLDKYIKSITAQFYEPKEPKKMPKDWVSIHHPLEEILTIRLASLTTQIGVQSLKSHLTFDNSDPSVLQARKEIETEIERVRKTLSFS